MSRSILRRISGGIAAAALAITTLGVVGAATPASAATCATSVTLKAYKGSNEFGGYNSLSAQTSSTGTCGTPYVGKTYIQRWTGRAWTNVATSSGSSYASLYGSGRFNVTATYRAYYSGGQSNSTIWQASAPATVALKTFRKVTFRDRSTRRASAGLFKIRPAATIAGKKAIFQVRKGGGWRAYKKVRVPRTGNIKVKFANSRKGIKYRMILAPGRGMAQSTHGPITARRY